MDAITLDAPLRSLDPPGVRAARCVELVVATLLLIGLVMAYSASAPYAARTGTPVDTWSGFMGHGVKLLIGLALFAGARRVPLAWIERHHGKLLLATLALLLLVLVPGVGARINGARRWFQSGPLTFQPVELAKIVVVAAVAARLAAMGAQVTHMIACARLLVTVVAPVCVLLCLQPDFGSTLLLTGVVFLLIIFAGAKPLHYMPATVIGFGGLTLAAWKFMPHVLERFTQHFDPQPGDQAYQSLIALGSGGFAGIEHGVGAGMAKLGYLPMVTSDFVFAVIGEEMGFLGASLVVFLFLLFTVMAARIAVAQQDMFRFLLASGITLGIAIQVLINLVVVTAVTPTKGIALPFISAGGSSLAMSLLAVGILVNIARSPRAPDAASAAAAAQSHNRVEHGDG